MNSIAINFVDCAIIILYLIFIIWWGLRNGKSSDAGSYFLAGRTMPWWIVGLSLFAASISSTTLIGQSGDAYHTGVAVFNYNLTGVVVMVFFATFLLPLYIRSGIFTIPEFLERRFDKRSRYYFSGICIVGNIFLDAAGALYAAALIIKLLFPEADLQLIIIIFAVLAASYTIPGGLSSAIIALLPFAASASASACAPPKKAVATAAHMRAMMLSEIIAPKKTERHSRSLRTQRAISGDCVA